MVDEPLLPVTEENAYESGSQRKGTSTELALKICMVYACGTVYAARTVIPLVVPEVAKELEWSSILVGYVLSFFFWGYALTQVLGGLMADRVGGARIMVAMSTVGAISLLLFPPLVSIWPQAAILLRCLLGLVQGPHYPSLGSLSSQLVPAPRRPLFFSTALLGSPLGTILVGLVGSVLLEGLGWRAVVTLTGLLYASSALWLYVLTRGQGVPARAAAGASAAVPWRGLLSSGRVWACILAHMSHTTAWFLLISWLPSYFQRVHPQAEGWLVNTLPFVLNGAGTMASVPLAAWLLRHQFSVTATRKLIEVGSQLIAGAAMLALPRVSSSAAAVLLTSLSAGAVSLHANGGLALPQDLCPQHVGALFGLMNTGGALAGFLSNLAAGYLLELHGDFEAVFHMVGGLALAGALVFAAFGSAERLKL